MKKILYFLAFGILALSACQKNQDLHPTAVVKVVPVPTVASITLGATDYAHLSPSTPASTQQFFHGTTDAFANIPTILTQEYPTAADKSQITVTYATSPVVPAYFKPVDSLYSHDAYTLTAADYNNSFNDFSAAQFTTWFNGKYNSVSAPPVDHQETVLTFTYYDGVSTYTTTQSYVYLNGAWVKAYVVTPAQYVSVNRTSNYFGSADNNLVTLANYFNTFLKNDPTIVATAKVGDVQYVSYKYFVSAANTYERVLPMAFDGTNWVASNTIATNLFTLSGGVWTGQLDNTVYYTLVKADYTAVGAIAAAAPISAGATAITNMVNNADFTLNSATSTSRWSDAQIANGIILGVLTPKYAPNAATVPSANQKFVITFSGYSQYTSGETYTFIYNGGFVYQPTPDNAKYTITGDDYATIAGDATTGATAAAMTNLLGFGDFSMTGASAWTKAQINAGIANVLKARYTTATSGQTVVVSYAIYNGGNQITTTAFKYNGTAWISQ